MCFVPPKGFHNNNGIYLLLSPIYLYIYIYINYTTIAYAIR